MRLPAPHRHIRKGLTHPNRLVAAATWLSVIAALAVLVRLLVVLASDFWVILIAWMQP